MKTENERFEDVFDKILRWYKSGGDKKLPPELEARLVRWKAAQSYILLFKPLTSSEVVNYLVTTFAISEPRAWRDLNDTRRLFSNLDEVNEQFDKIMLIAQIKDLRAKAISASKLAIAAQCDATLAKIGQYDQPDTAVEGNKQIILNLQFNPKLVGAKEIPNLLGIVEKFIGEKAKRELMIEDTDFEELPAK